MNWLKEVLVTILVAGAVIWVPCVIGAGLWAVRYARRRKQEREEVIYE